MKTVANLSDLITVAQNHSPSFVENKVLSDLYRTIKEGPDEKGFYKGQGVFRDTHLIFFEKEHHFPVAPSLDDLPPEQLARGQGRLLLKVTTNYDYKYPSTDAKQEHNCLKIERGEAYLDGEKIDGRKVKEIIVD